MILQEMRGRAKINDICQCFITVHEKNITSYGRYTMKKKKQAEIISFEPQNIDNMSTGLIESPIVISMIETLGLNSVIDENLEIDIWNRKYEPNDLLKALLFVMILEDYALEDADDLMLDEFIVSNHFDPMMTVSDFIGRFSDDDIRETVLKINDAMVKSVVSESNLDRITIDIDVSVETDKVYGKKSILYMFASYAAEIRMMITSMFLLHDESIGNSAVDLLDRTLSLIPEGTILHMRSENVCYRYEVVEFCEKHEITFSITADVNAPLIKKMESLTSDHWECLNDKEEVCQLLHRPSGWKKEYRLIATRNRIGNDLFGPLYEYKAFVTNSTKKKPPSLVSFHRQHDVVLDEIKNKVNSVDYEKL